MGFQDSRYVRIYEEKFRLESIYDMYRHGRIIFPDYMSHARTKVRKKLHQLVDAIWTGIPVPVIYVSELQNGSFLVIESDDKLWTLIHFLADNISLDIQEEEFMEQDCYFFRLMNEYPKHAQILCDTRISLQIIDYSTPRYLHMQIGRFVEDWSISKEQAIRKMLYPERVVREWEEISYIVGQAMRPYFRIKNTLVNEYRTMYMLMYWFIYQNVWHRERGMGEQLLLEKTIFSIVDERRIVDSFLMKVKDYAPQIHDVIGIYNRESKKIIPDRCWGLLICAADMGNDRGRSCGWVTDLLVSHGKFYNLCLKLENSQLTRDYVERALMEIEREIGL